jgi:hypothetical protein
LNSAIADSRWIIGERVIMRIRVIGWLLLTAAILFLPTLSIAQVGPPTVAPPELPTYEQPLCPGDGYIWTPGYWAWDGAYYWVPGTWVMAPDTGDLWTPGYWGWGGGGWMFNEGYWGLSVGFYGGIDYGFGYFGHGYEGGRWENGHFSYNTAVSHVDGNSFHNVYNARVSDAGNRVSYNGGQGGVNARATAEEEAAGHSSTRMGPVSAQTQHAWAAHNDPQQHASAGRASPGVTATARANTAVHPNDLPPVERPTVAKTGNAKQDQKNQKEQDKVVAKQNQDRQKLQQQQDKEHQQQTKQAANQQKTQQTEQRHQQQTQQMHQAHTQQMQQMGQRQSSGGGGSHGGGGHH